MVAVSWAKVNRVEALVKDTSEIISCFPVSKLFHSLIDLQLLFEPTVARYSR